MLDMRDAPITTGADIIYIQSDGGRMWGKVIGFSPKMVKVIVGYSRNPEHYIYHKTVSNDNILVL